MLFLLAVNHHLTSTGDYSVALPADVHPDDVFTAVDSFNAQLQMTRSWVFAGGLQPLPEGATIDATGDGMGVTDRGRTTPPEALGGFWVIDVDDRNTALDWARRASAACRQPVQLRPFQGHVAA